MEAIREKHGSLQDGGSQKNARDMGKNSKVVVLAKYWNVRQKVRLME